MQIYYSILLAINILFCANSISMGVQPQYTQKDIKHIKRFFRITASYPLHNAIVEGDINLVKNLLSENKGEIDSLGLPDVYETPLYIACYRGYVDIAKLLIDSGADVNAEGRFGCHSLYGAAVNVVSNYKETIELLVKAGAKINKECTGLKVTPFDLATSNNHLDVVKFLIKFGADKKRRLYFGYRLLAQAIIKDDTKIIFWLLNKDANPDINSKHYYDKNTNNELRSTLEVAHIYNKKFCNLVCSFKDLRDQLISSAETIDIEKLKNIERNLEPETFALVLLIMFNELGDNIIHYFLNNITSIRNDKESVEKTKNIIMYILEKQPNVAITKNYDNISPLKLAVKDAPEILELIVDVAFRQKDKKLNKNYNN